MKLLLSPHSDDECLFASYTLMREKPLVIIVTDSDLQRSVGITAEMRRQESRRGCETLGVAVAFLGLKDAVFDEADLRLRLEPFACLEWQSVYAPAIQGGHRDHDLIGKVASALFARVKYYSTYTKENFTPVGEIEIVPTAEEIDRKNKALDCYTTQIRLPNDQSHFGAVRGKPEYLNHTAESWRAGVGSPGGADRLW